MAMRPSSSTTAADAAVQYIVHCTCLWPGVISRCGEEEGAENSNEGETKGEIFHALFTLCKCLARKFFGELPSCDKVFTNSSGPRPFLSQL